MSNELSIFPMQDLQTMARAICASKFAGCDTPEQAMTLMLIAQAEGRHPGIIARDYHIIKGRPTLKADAMLARFQDAGGCVRWVELNDIRAEAVFSHPKGGELSIDWDMERAKKAGVIDGNPTWKKYPRSMLRSRVVSEGIRSVYPAVICGSYTPEEMDDVQQEPRTPEYSVQPPASATAAEAGAAMEKAAAESRKEKRAATEDDRPAFVDFIQTAGAALGTFEPIIDIMVSHGYDTPEAVAPMDFRSIMKAVKALLPK